MSSLRIAFATPEYTTEKRFDGGLANYLHRIATALVPLGHEVHVITLSELDQAEFEHDGVQVHRVVMGKFGHRLNRVTGDRIRRSANWLDLNLRVYQKLKQIHQQTPLDMVQFPSYSSCGILSSLFLKVPYVVRLSSYRPAWHRLTESTRTLDLWLMECLEEWQLRLSRHIYAPSYALQKLVAEETGIDRVKVIRTPCYIETQHWDDSLYDRHLTHKQYLLFFGRFQPHKGFHILAQALPPVLEQYPDAYAVFVGQDMGSPLADSMQDYARSQCNQYVDRLIFLPQLPHHQLYPIITHAHLVVLPSLIDNLPNACLEAMALGKPVIGTIGTSFDELITDGETGFLVVPGNVNALSQTIIAAWNHPHLDSIGQAARQRMTEFSPDATVAAVLNLYQEILQAQPMSQRLDTPLRSPTL
jgi:glycosyltransferase involved in cell wall biosynthesis